MGKIKELRYRDYTLEEIAAMPLELRCCFHLMGWNGSAHDEIVDVQSWAKAIGFMRCQDEYLTHEQSVSNAANEADDLIIFVREQMRLEAAR